MAEPRGRAFLTWWIVAYTLGWVVGGAFSASVLPALIGWGLAALFQWLVIRTVLPQMGAWVLLTALGGALGVGSFAITEVFLQRYDPPTIWAAMRNPATEDGRSADTSAGPSAPIGPQSGLPPALWVWPLAGGVVGMAMGAAQWLLLRRHVIGAAWWIPANLVAWSAGSVVVGMTLLPRVAEPDETRITVRTVSTVVAVGGACAGALSGAALAALLRRRRDPASSPPSRAEPAHGA